MITCMRGTAEHKEDGGGELETAEEEVNESNRDNSAAPFDRSMAEGDEAYPSQNSRNRSNTLHEQFVKNLSLSGSGRFFVTAWNILRLFFLSYSSWIVLVVLYVLSLHNVDLIHTGE